MKGMLRKEGLRRSRVRVRVNPNHSLRKKRKEHDRHYKKRGARKVEG